MFNQRGFASILFILGVLLVSVSIIGGAYYYKQNYIKTSVQTSLPKPSIAPTVTASPSLGSDGIGTAVVQPSSATPSASTISPSDRYGDCPAGYVQYGVPLGCVKPEVIEKCKNQYGGCPICLASNTMIDTPNGEVNVKDLKIGMRVWSVNKNGEKIAVRILNLSSTPTSKDHIVVHLVLADGREVFASPDHPTINNLTVLRLKVGEKYDNSFVVKKELIPYWDNKTYDLLPDGDTGYYYADKILLGSTLKYSF